MRFSLLLSVVLVACGGSSGIAPGSDDTQAARGNAPTGSVPSPTPAPKADTPPPSTQPPLTDPPKMDPPALQDGSWEHPFWLSGFPATASGDTTAGGVSVATTYSCDTSKSEAGPEYVYAFQSTGSGVIAASLDDVSGDTIDLDVQLLDAADPGACLARNNISVAHAINANKTYYIVVDTFGTAGATHPGPFKLTVNFTANVADGTCPSDMLKVPAPSGDVCMDRFEAPNVAGQQPLVMYSFDESEAWCGARGKRLCFNDEWTFACAGPSGRSYVWGESLAASPCNTKKTYRQQSDSTVGQWPGQVNTPQVVNRAALFTAAAMASSAGSAAAAHVESLYQAEGSGAYPGCVNEEGVTDLTGSVEEWTRRRDGGEPSFHGSLKGRYWADTRTCQNDITNHGDAFRFYEIGFRCCR